MADTGVGIGQETAGEEDPANSRGWVLGGYGRPRAYPPKLGDSKPCAPVALLRSAQQSARLGPALPQA